MKDGARFRKRECYRDAHGSGKFFAMQSRGRKAKKELLFVNKKKQKNFAPAGTGNIRATPPG